MSSTNPSAGGPNSPSTTGTLAPPTGPAPSQPTPPAPPRRSDRVPLYVAAGSIAIVVILVALVVGNALPTPPAGASVMTYEQAQSLASNAVSGYLSGGWSPILASGVVATASYTVPVNSTSGIGSTCTFTPAPAAPLAVEIPSYTGSLTDGLSPAWEFLYANSASGFAEVTVVGGTATVLGSLSGTGCTFFDLFSSIPSTVIDSSEAAGATSAAASAFLSAHPVSNGTYELDGAYSAFGHSFGPQWSLRYSTCPSSGLSGSNMTGAAFNATVDATTGNLFYSQTLDSVSC